VQQRGFGFGQDHHHDGAVDLSHLFFRGGDDVDPDVREPVARSAGTDVR